MNSQPSIARIQKVCARRFGVSVKDMKSPNRSRSVARPRQMAMSLSRRLTGRSFPEIGRLFGGRDHTTVLHAIRKIADLVEVDDVLKNDFEALQQEILEGVETTGSLASLAKHLAPIIAEEINRNFIIQIEQFKAEACQEKEVVIVANEVEPELLQAISAAARAYEMYEDDKYTRGEPLSLQRFFNTFEKLREVHREFESPKTPRETKS